MQLLLFGLLALPMFGDQQMASHKVESGGSPNNSLRVSAHFVGITEQNLSLFKSGKVRGVRFGTLLRICEYLECQPGDTLHFEPEEEDARVSVD